MSEGQEKLIESWLKKCLAERRLRKYLIIIAILFVVCAITFIAVVMSIPGTGTPPGGYYRATKSEIQDAVKIYQDNNYGELPTANGTVTINSSLCHIIDICVLIGKNDEMLLDVPTSCASINGSDNDNCDSGCDGCHVTSHYIWAVDGNGSVYSTCTGDDCAANGENGYQGVWP